MSRIRLQPQPPAQALDDLAADRQPQSGALRPAAGLIALAEHLGVKNATLMWPVRIAAAGKLVTPGGAVEICHILGKDETLRRLRLGLDKLRA